VIILCHLSEVNIVVDLFFLVNYKTPYIEKFLVRVKVLSWNALLSLQPTCVQTRFLLFTLGGLVVDHFFKLGQELQLLDLLVRPIVRLAEE
jgi:hypothetical protein